MTRKIVLFACVMCLAFTSAFAAKVNKEKTIQVGTKTRKYILYVPDNVKENPALVFSLHGASGHDTDRSPFRTSVADSKGCIVVYPQGEGQYFPIFGGTVNGWDASGEPNEDLDFFKAIIEDVAESYTIDRKRIYCCGFSNGGMMTYAMANCASDIFAAFASISGFPLNEFHHRHTGVRPVPFLHIHGKSDDFVKYSCMPIIRDNMVARNGCDPVGSVSNRTNYRRSTYESANGGFTYIYYEIEGMGHNDYTDKTLEANSALTMWMFMSKYSLDSECDTTLKWCLNIDTPKFKPEEHGWTVNDDKTRFSFGTAKKANNADNNVYSTLQFEKGDYKLCFESTGTEGNKIHVLVETMAGKKLFCYAGEVGKSVVVPFSVSKYGEYKISIVKDSAEDLFTKLAIYSTTAPVAAENAAAEDKLPEASQGGNTEAGEGYLIEIPQSQGKEYDTSTRTDFVEGKEYNTYTSHGQLNVGFKMKDIDVKDCDYVLIKFAEPTPDGWCVAFWPQEDPDHLVSVPTGSTEYKFVFAEDTKGGAVSNDKLAQVCLMTLWCSTNPLVAKVSGVYKHSTKAPANAVSDVTAEDVTPVAYYSLSGSSLSAPKSGVNIVRMSDGSVKKMKF